MTRHKNKFPSVSGKFLNDEKYIVATKSLGVLRSLEVMNIETAMFHKYSAKGFVPVRFFFNNMLSKLCCQCPFITGPSERNSYLGRGGA